MNTIFNENCSDTIEKLDNYSINGVITSPPYNIIRPNSTDRGYDEYKDGMSNDEYIDWQVSIFKKLEVKLKKNGCICYNISYGTENTTTMTLLVAEIIKKTDFTIADIIIWKKDSATPNNVSSNKLTRICEHIYVFCRKDEFYTFEANKKVLSVRSTGQKIYENVFNFISAKNNDGSNNLNKATYSTELVDKLIAIYFKRGSTIYDPFMGTGTTAVSCIRNGCEFIGSEISLMQCNYANERVDTAMGNVGLFGTQGELFCLQD